MYKLIIFDCDGVFFPDVNIWMKVHEVFGTLEEGKLLTEKYLDSDYDRLVEEVVNKLWKGKDASLYFDMINNISLHKGIDDLFNYLIGKNLEKAIISGSSLDLVKRISESYKINFVFANELVIKNNLVTGEFNWSVGNALENKASIFHKLIMDLNIDAKEAIYIGDSKRDIHIFKEVGLPIAFNSKDEELKKHSKEIVNSNDLRDLIPVLDKHLRLI
ncbi:HAD-IB family phosphatase [Candidatus Woesearchaeota archaeon]|nr:HAD-IB family phosphatase [Candidatus Woesearchaeota archaeon]MCF7901586.1 HAD-IB family phosphatase [Candidatus Woesearchaeota archaeon]MCF8013649.1 HAD-IB family phosphatase [Candidatus Woesearchaeota archaeon]